jgi:putative YphP/YqiW family bacilliredoxin
MPMKGILKRRVRSLFVVGAVVFACGAIIISAQTESFSALVSRLRQGKATFAKRQQDLLAARYDLADRARERMPEVAPSSPSVALFKDGALVYALERRHIERMSVNEIAGELVKAFSQHCARTGPSVPPDVYEKVVHARQCGSQVPSFRG